MRPKQMLIVTGLAALPLLLAFLLIGTGGLTAPNPSSPTLPAGGARVSLELKGGRAGGRTDQCGVNHAYRTYPGQGTIRFRGAITPAGVWRVSVKLKACYGGQFQSAGDAQARVSRDGSYSGGFPIPIGGYYFARSELRSKGQVVARSEKVYFAVR